MLHEVINLSISTTIQRGGVSVAEIQRGRRSTGIPVTLLVLLCFVGLGLLFTSAADNPAIIIALGVSLIFAVCIIRWPVTGTYMAVVMAILFDTLPSAYAHTFFSDLGVFRNLSYVGLPEGVVVSLFELVVVLSLISALVHRFHNHMKLVQGPLFWPMVLFGVMVVAGEASGILSGRRLQDLTYGKFAPLMYLVALYLLAVNTINGAAQIRTLLWITIFVSAIRCAEGMWRYFQIPAATRGQVPTVLEHEDSLFPGDAFCIGAGRGSMAKLAAQTYAMVAYSTDTGLFLRDPNQSPSRCLPLHFPKYCKLLAHHLDHPQDHSRNESDFIYALVVAAFLGAAYLAAFWNSSNGIAAPAQSIRSMIQPDERDYLSNLYRDEENTQPEIYDQLQPDYRHWLRQAYAAYYSHGRPGIGLVVTTLHATQ